MEHMLRPKAKVLPESAVVPERNLLVPPPDHFTHELTGAQPYYYSRPKAGAPADGEFAAGTKVVLLGHEGERLCRVADGRGLYVVTPAAGLRELG